MAELNQFYQLVAIADTGTLSKAAEIAGRKDGIYLEDLAGETMLLFKEIGIWKDRVISKMSQTKFILQEQEEALSTLIQVSALPAFASDLTLKHGDRRQNQNRLALPILDPEAHVTFYCSVHKSHKTYLADIFCQCRFNTSFTNAGSE